MLSQSSNPGELPDEIVSRILHPLFLIPDLKFFDTSDVSPFSKPVLSSSAYLLVRKQWMRVGTPLLYRSVVIRTKAQAQALEKALKRNPTFGSYTIQLRVEGGFGMHSQSVIKVAPNISDLAVSIALWTPDTATGLIKNLGSLNKIERLAILASPKTPYIYGLPSNRSVVSLATAIAHCLEHSWKSLHTCFCGWNFEFATEAKTTTLLHASLTKAPTLHSLHFWTWQSSRPPHAEIRAVLAEFKTLRHVTVLSDTNPWILSGDISRLMDMIPNGLDATFRNPHDPKISSSNDSHTALSNVPVCSPLHDSPEDVQERIWSRILYFASEIDHIYSEEELKYSPPRKRTWTAIRKPSPFRTSLQFCLVSRRFCRLTKPYICRDVVLDTFDKLMSFAELMVHNREVGANIRTIELSIPEHDHESHTDITSTLDRCASTVTRVREQLSMLPTDITSRENETEESKKVLQRWYAGGGSVWVTKYPGYSPTDLAAKHASLVECSHLVMEFILSQAPRLIKFTSREAEVALKSTSDSKSYLRSSLRFPFWRQILKLNGKYLQSLSVQLRIVPGDSLDLSGFTNLKFASFGLPYGVSTACLSTLIKPGESTLPVEFLRYDNSHGSTPCRSVDRLILRSLLAHSFPSLKDLHLRIPEKHLATEDSKIRTVASLALLFMHYGQTLQVLRVSGWIPEVPIFTLCPALRFVHLDDELPNLCNDHSELFTCKPPHTSLQRIQLGRFIDLGFPYVSGEYYALNFTDFPALKVVQVDRCLWPDSRRRDQKGNKNHWLEIRENLLKSGIKLTDRFGSHWTPTV